MCIRNPLTDLRIFGKISNGKKRKRLKEPERFQMKLYNTWLYFFLYNAIGDEFLEYNLPSPNYLLKAQKGVFIGWLINGYPGTSKSREYFNDIIARFIIAYKQHKPERLPYKPNLIREALIDLQKSYELDNFQNLPSLYWANKKVIWSSESVGTIDQIFWAIKLYTEELIKEFGEGTPIPYEMLEDFAFRNFFGRKDNSTLRAKCRAIWNWYDERNWTIPKRKVWKMTRRERALTNAKNIKEKKRRQILNAVTGIMKDEYIKDDGTWNIYKLTKDLGMSDNTVRKHIKALIQEGIIPEKIEKNKKN
jgi:predicted transcriptional regulator